MSKSDRISLSEILAEIGDDNYKLQPLSNCIKGFKQNKRDTTIEFYTGHENTPELVAGPTLTIDTPKIGVILWIDREDYDKAYKALLEKQKGKTE
ncbi:hypothetical protein EAb13_CDS0085 [Acinetobacter phage EAb13]|nr:hypothetical protein EAb13_CDS0085 [Acinetobacter phage EAb13]